MTTPSIQLDKTQFGLLDDVIGYLNFSSGASEPKFLRNLNALFRAAEQQSGGGAAPTDTLCGWLQARIDQLPAEAAAFGDVGQARAVVRLLHDELLPAYRKFHRDLLWHQPDDALWRPLFLGRACEAILAQGGPWQETERIVTGAIETLNDYIGYRPLAVLESEQPMEPYRHEWVRPVPLFVREVGVACGRYAELVGRALDILAEIDPDILHQAWFDLEQLDELAMDPRAYDFDNPASKRPNHHFGQWDLHSIDNRGHYRRFVLQQITLDALLSRVEESEGSRQLQTTNVEIQASPSGVRRSPSGQSSAPTRDELLFEAAAVMAGTILMASGTTGNGPECHGSDVTLSNLLPHIASYRDHFYEQLLERVAGPHGERLRAEAKRARQPFAAARQHLNHELARRRAAQMQHVHLAQLYARMGYPESALAEAHTVRTASARMLCQIYCRLSAGHHAIDARQLDEVARYVPEIEDLLQRGIECGALVDPWNIIGFGGNFSLFPALENTVQDFRVDDLIELVEQVLDLCARAWTEAAAIDDATHEAVFSAALERLAAWWDKYAAASVSGVRRLVGKEAEISTNLVAGALSAWHKAGAAAGDVKFWRMFVDQFDSPKAFQLVVEALLDRGDLVASMALMLQWISQVERSPLEDGDASFHALARRWLRGVEDEQLATGEDRWPLVAKFFEHLEASAESYWHVPTFELADELVGPDGDELTDDDLGGVLEGMDDDVPFDDDEEWSDDEPDELFSAAYEDMVYRDSTDDGFDSELIDDFAGTEFELEEEAERLESRLEFLATVARLWKHAAVAWEASDDRQRQQQFDNWRAQAAEHYTRLLELVETVHRYPLQPPIASYESMIEFDRQRMIKDSLTEQIISTCVETADAGRLLSAVAGPANVARDAGNGWGGDASIAVLRAVLTGDTSGVRRYWPEFTRWLAGQELLYVPLAKGGRPRRIVAARAHGQLVHDLLAWLPRLGLVRETCGLLDIAQQSEVEHPVGPGAVTEFDRLFACGYRAIVRCLVASAEGWDQRRMTKGDGAPGDETRPMSFAARHSLRPSDTMLVEALQELTESQLHRWLTHSRTLRLSVVERLSNDAEWQAFVAFIERYGADLFTQKFLNLGNLRAILHQRAQVWLSNLENDPEFEELPLVQDLGTKLSLDEAAKWLTIAIEAVAENYREYRDYNTTTTHSDHGELLYTLVDFLRLRAAYDRVAWNLRPVVMAHEILVRQNRPIAAEMWQQALAERTAEASDGNLVLYEHLTEKYGVRLATVAERLSERFTRPLAIDRVRSLVEPAIEAAGSDDRQPFAALREEIESLVQEPAGAGLDLPDWLAALEEEVTMVRCTKRQRESNADVLRRIEQAQLDWDDWQRQIGEDGQ